MSELKLKVDEIERGLAGFSGSENWYKHPIGTFNYTDGVKYLADKCGAHWLIDIVGSYQIHKVYRAVDFQIWRLKVNHADNTAVVTMQSDSNNPPLITQEIPFTDFPLDEVKLWLIGDYDNKTLILPGEY